MVGREKMAVIFQEHLKRYGKIRIDFPWVFMS